MKSKQNRTQTGMVWYNENEWERMKNICVDSEKLENSFKDWEEMTQKAFEELNAEGMKVVKVFVNADEFYIWCIDHSLPLDASSRSQYVVTIMALRDNH
jgi:hypothetical protein